MAAQAGADSILLDRLRQALAPQYTLDREIARGGMGAVYLAHDVALDRPVAVKLLLPELATAELAARFIREAQVLARLRHPNIVTVHQVAESGGLFYYIMEWLEGETLQSRLARGHLTRAAVIRLGTELLDALDAAHRQGWIHRDVKPGNIFLTEDRAILTDFGIARSMADDTTLTGANQLIGTLAYMSPEQREGRPVTPATDIYSAGLVLHEAMSGRRWWRQDRESGDWSGVPSPLRGVLRKALQLEPAHRWGDAARFRNALIAAARPRILLFRPLVGALLLIAFGSFVYYRSREIPQGGRQVRVLALESRGSGSWGDSIGSAIVASLSSFPDLVVTGPHARNEEEPETEGLVLSGIVEPLGTRLRATIHSRPGSSRHINVTREADESDWRSLADSLATQLIFAIYQSDANPDPSLPGDVLPRTPAGWHAWSRAEPLFTQARWGDASVAYREAEAIDSSCLLCAFRINDIDRWLDQPHDPARLARLQAHIEAFPPHYQLLIRAAAAAWPERMVLMDSAARTRDFFLASFHRGDEIFHRGPLFGRHRSEALADLERTVQLRPDFAPGWEHLAWLRISEGDSAGAKAALDQLASSGEDPMSVGLRFLLQAAFAYRFASSAAGDMIVNRALQIPEVAAFPFLAAGPRLMLTFEAPEASVGMGRIFARRRTVADIRSGALAQVFGHLVLGQTDSALHYARMLQSRVPGVEADLFAAQLAGALALLDPDSTETGRLRAVRAREELRQFTLSGAAGDQAKRRAAWMEVLLAERTGGSGRVQLAHHLIGQGADSAARYYAAFIQANNLARRGLFDRALELTTWNGSDLVRLPDPFFSAVSTFYRAEWFAQLGNTRSAITTLLWHEANDFGTYPIGDAQPAEVNLALSTLAWWTQARLLDQDHAFVADACRGYRAVSRAWRDGTPVYRERASIARERLSSLSCDA